MKKLTALLFILLTACAVVPPKATSIEDYCQAVALESSNYAQVKYNGADKYDLIGYIRLNMSKTYPPREVDAMVKVVGWVYDESLTPSAVEGRCIAQRHAGTWFKHEV